jgi:hypothetical protein
MGRQGRRRRFALRHALGEPLEPLPAGLSLRVPSQFGDVSTELSPGLPNRAAVEVIDYVNGHFALEDEYAEALPHTQQSHDRLCLWFRQCIDVGDSQAVGHLVEQQNAAQHLRGLQ